MIYIFCESKKYVRILNAGPDLSQPMTEDEVIKFLTTGKRNIYLGTIDRKNEPNIHPTSYYFDPDQLKFYVESYKFSKKIENMKNNKKIYFCVDKPTIPYKGVRGKAKISLKEDLDFTIFICQKNLIKYLGSIEGPMAKVILNRAIKGESIVIEISPLYFSTWDDSKIT